MVERTPKLSEEQLYFFEDQICSAADLLLRFGYSLMLNREDALKSVQSTLEDAATKISDLQKLDEMQIREQLLTVSFRNCVGKENSDGSHLAEFLGRFPKKTRGVFIARDIAGLSTKLAGQVVGCQEDEAVDMLIDARKTLLDHFG